MQWYLQNLHLSILHWSFDKFCVGLDQLYHAGAVTKTSWTYILTWEQTGSQSFPLFPLC